MQEATLLTLP